MTNMTWNMPQWNELRREVGRWLENTLGAPIARMETARPFPALNVWEDNANLHVETEVPGLTMNDLEVYVVGSELTIKGRRKPLENGQFVYHRRECGRGEFARHLTLPVEVDAARVEATLKDGILNILLPKAEKARARKVTVKTA